ncbi:phage head spike fiber domain-containing protein [Aeromonas caviae]|uniref:phage head spike fiber domain-containing protein n=1 Tax=Aeromonas caviae TaxID=648 RepID=UPI003014F3C6
MTTTAAGDAAVARLNKATEAFEKIITGASNQVVDVPGYGNQPTLAARVDERLDETTTTAAAEANRSRDEADRATTQANAAANSVTLATAEFNKAKTQADRAQSEADRAAQITGLDTVSDAVAMAALPLPDVWAPLSDSLRLITGYGRDVLVGSDVVARMVNFSRSTTATYIGKDGLLKTAAANEPRFEKAGLLVEGQSTNLNPRSQQFNWMDGYGASPAVQSPNTDPQTSSLITTIDVTAGRRRPFIAGILTVGKKYTISFRAKSDGGVISQVSSQLTGAVYPAVAPEEWKTYSFTGVAIGPDVDFQITGTSVSIAWIQVEELPFASSYIPTNGAAVTRAADVCFIPEHQNIYSGGTNVSFSCEVDTKWGNNRIFEAGDATMFYVNEEAFSGRVSRISTKPIVNSYILGSRAIVAASISPARVTSRLNGIVVSGVPSIAGNAEVARLQLGNRSATLDRPLNGHIRNFRIWHSALTDEQMKAIR